MESCLDGVGMRLVKLAFSVPLLINLHHVSLPQGLFLFFGVMTLYLLPIPPQLCFCPLRQALQTWDLILVASKSNKYRVVQRAAWLSNRMVVYGVGVGMSMEILDMDTIEIFSSQLLLMTNCLTVPSLSLLPLPRLHTPPLPQPEPVTNRTSLRSGRLFPFWRLGQL